MIEKVEPVENLEPMQNANPTESVKPPRKPMADLTLRADDPRVMAAREAEARLFAHYGLQVRERFIPLPDLGIKLRVTETGSGSPVLIVPGNTGDGFPFIPLIPELGGKRVIILNRPGGGLSEGMDHRRVSLRKFAVETLNTVFDALSLDAAPVIAHSMGGHWSLWFAMDRPERVKALCLLGVPGNVLDTSAPLPLRLASIPGPNRLLFRLITPREPSRSLGSLAFMGHSPATCAALPKAMGECYFHFPQLPHYRLSSLSLMETTNRLRGSRPEVRIDREALQGVKPPVLLIWGTHDPFGRPETGRQIAEALPRGTFRPINGGGHLPWLDAPEECGRLIGEFLAKVE
jgi:pimeloyl-ACP methyl ester carboxylesterase